jgi:hypothetical protein
MRGGGIQLDLDQVALPACDNVDADGTHLLVVAREKYPQNAIGAVA